MKNASDREMFSRSKLADQQGIIWTPLKSKKGLDRTVQAIKLLNNSKLSLVRGNLDHLKLLGTFWEKYGLESYQTSGFYFTSCAIAFCDEVHLFGFWPFRESLDGRNVTAHYYDNIKLTPGHDTPYEWKLLLALHHHGLIKLHIDTCIDTHADHYL